MMGNSDIFRYWGVCSRRTDCYATGLVIKKGVGDRKHFGM
jgi:hypothetical protein